MVILKYFLVSALIIVFVLYVYFKKCFMFWKNKGVYTEAPRVPFGNAANLIFHKENMATEFGRLYQKCAKKSIPFCGFYFFTKPILIIANLEVIRSITKTDFDHFTNRVFHLSDSDPLSLNLVSLKGSRWRIMRNKLSPVFTPTKFKLMYDIIENCNFEMLSQIGVLSSKGESVEMKNMADRFTTDVIINCAFGLQCKTVKNENTEFLKVGSSFYSTSIIDSTMFLVSMLNPNIFNWLNLKSTKPDIENFFLNTVKMIVKEREDNNVIKKDFMHTLLQIRNNVDVELNEVKSVLNKKNVITSLSIADIAAQCFIFFVAGFETSSSTITFCLYELALNSDYQDKIRDEVKAALKRHDGKLSYDLLMDLNFTQKCIKETLRKYPPLPTLTRECTKDYTMPSSHVTMKKGSTLIIPIRGVHFDPIIYPNPEIFDPERFSEENCAKRHPCAFLPFGYGPRNCIAYQFGYLESTLAVATLVHNFKLKLNPLTKVPLVIDLRSIMIRSKYSIFIDFEKIFENY